MRITGGTLKNRAVPVLNRPGLRPTSARVREAVFHRLGTRLVGARVWDVFGGSGMLALEAWSRGAEAVICTERDRKASRTISDTVRRLGAGIEVRTGDVRRMKLGTFDVILADPPYEESPASWLRVLSAALEPGGVLVFEHRSGGLARGRHDELRVEWQRRYGDTTVSFLERVPGLLRHEHGADVLELESEPVPEDAGMVESKPATVE